MSESGMQSALTAEEWRDMEIEAKYGYAKTSVSVDHKGRIFAHSSLGDEERVVIVNESYDGVAQKVAALCLYQQHFGFTREDVEFLRTLVEQVAEVAREAQRVVGAQSLVGDSEHRNAVEEIERRGFAIAHKINALLPPTESSRTTT